MNNVGSGQLLNGGKKSGVVCVEKLFENYNIVGKNWLARRWDVVVKLWCLCVMSKWAKQGRILIETIGNIPDDNGRYLQWSLRHCLWARHISLLFVIWWW